MLKIFKSVFLQITDQGMIVDETVVRQKVAQKDLREHTDAMLAQAVVRRTVEMEVCLPFPTPSLPNLYVSITEEP